MRRNYKYLYHAAPIPIVPPSVNHDPVRAFIERRAAAARLAAQRAKRRIRNTVELWIELIVPSMLALVLLPVLWVVGIVMLARALWRRYVQGRPVERKRLGDDFSRQVEVLRAAPRCSARPRRTPGATKTVEFVVPMRLRAYTGVSGDLVMEPGPVACERG